MSLERKDAGYERTGNRSSEAEIDLSFVYSKLGKAFSSIGRRISKLFDILYRRIALLLGFTVLGFIAGFGMYSITKPYYNSSMTLVLANIRNEFIEDQLNKLTEMVDEDNYQAIAERLDISLQNARLIKEMKFSNLDQDRIEEDSILTGSPFRIELSLYDSEYFETMEPAITNYIENNRYFARQKRIKQRQVENMVSKLKNEISSIDSMKTSVGDPRGPVNGFVYGQPIDPTNLYRESITMYKEQVNLEADLEKLTNVEIVTGFIPRLKPTGPRLILYVGIGGLISLLIGILTALNLENRKRRRAGLA